MPLKKISYKGLKFFFKKDNKLKLNKNTGKKQNENNKWLSC